MKFRCGVQKKCFDNTLFRCFVLGMLVGAVVFILIFGFKIIDFTYVDRMLVRNGIEDLPQHYLGWEFFRRTRWHFPLGLTEGLIFPNKISVVYTDSIPLVALIFKLFSKLLPAKCQYFGLYGLACYMLQGGFGALISYKYKNSKLFAGCASLLFIISPIMLKRMFYHHALASHWLILAALSIWIYKNKFLVTSKCALVFSALCAITVLIHMYLVPMVLGIMMCYLLQNFIEYRNYKKVTVVFFSSLASIFVISYLVGLFYGGIPATADSYGLLGYNLNGFLNPLDTSLFVKNLPLSFVQHFEVYSYLGLGVVFFVLMSFVDWISKLFERKLAFSILYLPWILMCLVFTLLAIGPNLTFNEHLILDVKLPNGSPHILSIFRASARFIWPVYYVVYIYIIRFIAKTKSWNSVAAASFIVLLQVIDLFPIIKYKHDLISIPVTFESPLKASTWDELGRTHKNIIFYKPINDFYTNYSVQGLGYIFGEYALRYDLTLNATYLARNVSTQKDTEITKHFDSLSRGERYRENIYVFPVESNVPTGDYGLHYYRMDGIVVGTVDEIKGENELHFE